MSATVSISDWKAVRKGSLRGFVSAAMPSGMILHEVSVLVTNGKAWCSPPAKPMLDRDGRVLTDAAGKRRYSPIIEFATTEIRTRWSDAVIAGVLAAHPDVLDE